MNVYITEGKLSYKVIMLTRKKNFSKPNKMVLGESALQAFSADRLFFHYPKIHTAIQYSHILYSKAKVVNSQSAEEESITNVNTVTAYINHFLLLGVKTGAHQCWSTSVFTK